VQKKVFKTKDKWAQQRINKGQEVKKKKKRKKLKKEKSSKVENINQSINNKYKYIWNHIILFFSFIFVLGGDTLWHLHWFLQCVKCIIREFTPSTMESHNFKWTKSDNYKAVTFMTKKIKKKFS
jgi:NAD kinase